MCDADTADGGANWSDPHVFAEFVKRSEPWLTRYVYGLFRCAPNTVEPTRDIVQETYIQFWCSRCTLRVTTDAGAFAFVKRIAERKFIDHCRRNRIVPRQLLGDQMADQDIRRPPVTDHAASHERREYAAWHAPRLLDRLTPEELEVFLLHAFCGWTFQQIADALEEKLHTVTNRYYRALEKLSADRDELES